MFDLVLLPLQLLLPLVPFLIYHSQLYKPVHQILFASAQIMDQDVDQVLFAAAIWLSRCGALPAPVRRRTSQPLPAVFSTLMARPEFHHT